MASRYQRHPHYSHLWYHTLKPCKNVYTEVTGRIFSLGLPSIVMLRSAIIASYCDLLDLLYIVLPCEPGLGVATQKSRASKAFQNGPKPLQLGPTSPDKSPLYGRSGHYRWHFGKKPQDLRKKLRKNSGLTTRVGIFLEVKVATCCHPNHRLTISAWNHGRHGARQHVRDGTSM